MAETTIEWADYTFNPWRGCTKVSPGCANCYADKQSKRNPKTLGVWGPNGTRVVGAEKYWEAPEKWNDKAAADGVRRKVFCASLADVFEDWDGPVVNTKGRVLVNGIYGPTVWDGHPQNCPYVQTTLDDVRRRLFALIDATPNLDWLLVTKRPENIRRMWPDHVSDGKMMAFDQEAADAYGVPLGEMVPARFIIGNAQRKNVWLLASVENQEQADKRIPELLKCRDLSPVLGLSCEPLLGPVDLSEFIDGRECCPECGGDIGCNADGTWDCIQVSGVDMGCGWHGEDAGTESSLDWVIAGGESGPNARPMHPEWVRSLRDQCSTASVPFFFKQWGEFRPVGNITESGKLTDFVGMERIGKKVAGRLLDGQEWSQFPEVNS